MRISFCVALAATALATALANSQDLPPVGVATEATRSANAEIAAALPLGDRRDFENATRGLLAQIPGGVIRAADGRIVWDAGAYGFLDAAAPATVNPSLWRHTQLDRIHGLFELKPGLYQLRGYDTAVMTLIRSKTGWIVVDPLLSAETARAALALANQHLGQRPVRAVIFTHSHADHFGGVRGIASEADISGGLRIIAPQGFTQEAVAENLLAGNAMARRAAFQFGQTLKPGPTGQVGVGIGTALSKGVIGLIEPTEIVNGRSQLIIDGVEFRFINAPGTEAPAEFMFYLPKFHALCAAELATGTMHNLLTLRGAQIRDGLAWSRYLDEVLEKYGAGLEVVFASHSWPTFGAGPAREFLTHQRDIYRYIHDQTLRLANLGFTPDEIAEQLAEPGFLKEDFSTRGYYGTLSHNSKAVYQRYFGWWDGVPAHLHALPPEDAARKYVEFMGGPEQLLTKARASFDQGDYRWSAEVLNHLMFADPANVPARDWLAASYEQLGFQAESAIWRNYYLVAAQELRHGPAGKGAVQLGNADFLRAVPTAMLFDSLSVRFNPAKAGTAHYVINFEFPDREETICVIVGDDVAVPRMGCRAENAAATARMNRVTLDEILLGSAKFADRVADGSIQITGDPAAVRAHLALLDEFPYWFNVVTP
ncbi:MAG: MBL fold metallo-hydrolase [Gammaproteobacteria bacterium]|nr:MBL fold metallo-hydrolase [Gammaproteobacteria bacterium]